MLALRGREQTAKRHKRRYRLATVLAGFRSVFADPRAKVCFGSVFLEGSFIHGLFPYVALLLLATGETRSSISGLVIAAFGLGGVIYSLSVSVLVARVAQRTLMILGGLIAAGMLALIAFDLPWQAQCVAFAMLGFGFYLLHRTIRRARDPELLAAAARGAATSLHSSTFYLGQATGPVLYGFTFAHGLGPQSILAGALVVLGVSLTCARLLRHKVAVH